ncbi:hypothetical protein B0H11DRAFT_582691 [Mycena galericulata]|nr:hypothetical protein B0H11DRAFT_582691 [Mycena galericulata]
MQSHDRNLGCIKPWFGAFLRFLWVGRYSCAILHSSHLVKSPPYLVTDSARKRRVFLGTVWTHALSPVHTSWSMDPDRRRDSPTIFHIFHFSCWGDHTWHCPQSCRLNQLLQCNAPISLTCGTLVWRTTPLLRSVSQFFVQAATTGWPFWFPRIKSRSAEASDPDQEGASGETTKAPHCSTGAGGEPFPGVMYIERWDAQARAVSAYNAVHPPSTDAGAFCVERVPRPQWLLLTALLRGFQCQ